MQPQGARQRPKRPTIINGEQPMKIAKSINTKPEYQMPDDFLTEEEHFWIELENARAAQFEDFMALSAANNDSHELIAAE